MFSAVEPKSVMYTAAVIASYEPSLFICAARNLQYLRVPPSSRIYGASSVIWRFMGAKATGFFESSVETGSHGSNANRYICAPGCEPT